MNKEEALQRMRMANERLTRIQRGDYGPQIAFRPEGDHHYVGEVVPSEGDSLPPAPQERSRLLFARAS